MTRADKRWRAYTFWRQPGTGAWGVRDLGGQGEGVGRHAPRIVLAVTVRQAYYLCANNSWVDPSGDDPVGVLFDCVAVPPMSNLFAWHGRARCGHVLDAAPVIRLAHAPRPGVRAIRAALVEVREHERMCRVNPSKRP